MPNASWMGRGSGRGTAVALCLGAVSIFFTACSIHISKNGISGNIAGHSFSATAHALPSGFPTDVPLPDNARVIGGAGTNGGYDAVFAVPGTVTDGVHAYESKFQSSGYTVTNITAPATTVVPASGRNSSSTTVTLSRSRWGAVRRPSARS